MYKFLPVTQGIRKRLIHISLFVFIFCSALFSILTFLSLNALNRENNNRYNSYQLSEELRLSSDRLTMMARAYAATGEPHFLDNFKEILDIRNGYSPRPLNYNMIYWDFRMPKDGKPVSPYGDPVAFKDLLIQASFSEEELAELSLAQKESDNLVGLEQRAFALIAKARSLRDFKSTEEREKAIDIVYGNSYLSAKINIMTHINRFITLVEQRTAKKVRTAGTNLKIYSILAILSFVLLAVTLIGSHIYQRSIDHANITELEAEVGKRIIAESKAKLSLETKNLLLRELYHRTKNTLQQIRGLLKLQGQKYPKNAEVQKLILDCSSRINAIASVHNLLYRSQDLSHISLMEYVTELSETIQRSFNVNQEHIKFSVHIDDLQVLFDQAIPIGLILNELITNSLNHAFPDKRDGIISISIDNKVDNAIVMNYNDNGIGVPDDFGFENQTSLGLKLIHNICKDQLLGSIEMNGKNGMWCRIEIPTDIYNQRV